MIGSFLNVVVHRLPIMLERAWRAEVSEATEPPQPIRPLPARYNLCLPRSACPHCGHVLRAWENIPVLSYVLLRGRCSALQVRLSARAIRSSNWPAPCRRPARSRVWADRNGARGVRSDALRCSQ